MKLFRVYITKMPKSASPLLLNLHTSADPLHCIRHQGIPPIKIMIVEMESSSMWYSYIHNVHIKCKNNLPLPTSNPRNTRISNITENTKCHS